MLHLIDKGQRQESLSIREACRQSVFSLKGIRNLQLPLCTLYYALFLPVVHLVYINALIPRLRVPDFVIGELQLTAAGRMLVGAFWICLYGAGIFLIFVPLLMIFQRLKLSQAVRKNIQIWKQLTNKAKTKLALGCGVWFLAESLIVNFLPKALLINSDFNRFFEKFNYVADLSPLFNAVIINSVRLFLDESGISVFSGSSGFCTGRGYAGRRTGK
ncbi:MAG: glycerophosphoryl diester phosphodiesterase membrane domain-containing protein [Holdemania massiliensis]